MKDKSVKQGIEASLKWNIPDNIITRFASNMVVQTLESGFRLSFFEAYPDIVLDENQEPPREVQANCVASVIVPINKLPAFIGVLQQQYEKHKA